MLKGSFWWPSGLKQEVLLLSIGSMVLIHQSELFGLMDSQVQVFGWLPMQLAYDILFNLTSVVILYAMYRLAPEPPSDFDKDQNLTDSTGSTAGESTEVTADGGR